jgi:hypothetical protein
MKNYFMISAACLIMGSAVAQDSAKVESPWKKGGLTGLNFSQTYLSNWQGGGQNAINGTVLVNLFANYKKDKWTWDNSFDGAYGLTRLGEEGVLQKTDDRIEINSKVGHKTPLINTYWAAMANFRTQWDAGYDYSQDPSPLISNPFAPAYIIAGLGIDYKPSKDFTVYISPITSKTTIVNNQRLANAGSFGVKKAVYDTDGTTVLTEGEMMRYEVGGFFKMQYAKELMTNVKFSTKLDLFSNYLNNPQNIDVNWETLIGMKVNKFLSASLSTNLIYDDDIRLAVDRNDDGKDDGTGPRIQFTEVFALGIQFQF